MQFAVRAPSLRLLSDLLPFVPSLSLQLTVGFSFVDKKFDDGARTGYVVFADILVALLAPLWRGTLRSGFKHNLPTTRIETADVSS
jgi:hypothetical protein